MNPSPTLSVVHTLLRIGLPIVILLAAGLLASMLIDSRAMPARTDSAPRATLVETMTPTKGAFNLTVTGFGTVEAFETLTVKSQVGGQVRSVNADLLASGRVTENAVLFTIDPTDFKLVVAQRQADVAKASVALKMAEANQLVAEREWELLGETIASSELGEELARKEPQRREAEASLAAAKSRLQRAALDLERTTIRAPFNALVLSESIALGQIVSPNASLATLVGSDRFEVVANIPLSDRSRVRRGASVIVTLDGGEGQPIIRRGVVDRLAGDVERAGRLARVILTIDDPLALAETTEDQPLLLGAYVRVEIDGPLVDGLLELPRDVVHESNTIRVMSREGTLSIREIDIVVGRNDNVLARSCLEEGESIVTSPMVIAIEGMPLEAVAVPKRLPRS